MARLLGDNQRHDHRQNKHDADNEPIYFACGGHVHLIVYDRQDACPTVVALCHLKIRSIRAAVALYAQLLR
ncbi:MAG TPA: hypothetical protein VKJ65_13745, partial [Phycisphaerae bacterium]|nr:hypothetical protein [Phycisphaerae bacterium]